MTLQESAEVAASIQAKAVTDCTEKKLLELLKEMAARHDKMEKWLEELTVGLKALTQRLHDLRDELVKAKVLDV